jgi:hypothetical protein
VIITLEEALTSGRGTERPFNCPSHDDRNASASVNVLKGVWYCYSCMAHGVLDDHVPTVEEALAALAGTQPPRVYPEAWLDVFDADHASPYWVGRFGIEVASVNRCGTHPVSGHPTYPLRDAAGHLVGVVTRHADDPGQKYHYPFNTATSRTLYGVLRPCHVLVLVEGASDVMALQCSGIPEHWTVTGTFGAGVHYPQIKMIESLAPKVIVAAFDDDEAGMKAIDRAVETLADVAPVLSHRWRKMGVKDAGAGPASRRIKVLLDTLEEHGLTRYV